MNRNQMLCAAAIQDALDELSNNPNAQSPEELSLVVTDKITAILWPDIRAKILEQLREHLNDVTEVLAFASLDAGLSREEAAKGAGITVEVLNALLLRLDDLRGRRDH